MKRKGLCAAFIFTLLLSLTACGGTKAEETAPKTQASEAGQAGETKDQGANDREAEGAGQEETAAAHEGKDTLVVRAAKDFTRLSTTSLDLGPCTAYMAQSSVTSVQSTS